MYHFKLRVPRANPLPPQVQLSWWLLSFKKAMLFYVLFLFALQRYMQQKLRAPANAFMTEERRALWWCLGVLVTVTQFHRLGWAKVEKIQKINEKFQDTQQIFNNELI